MWWPFTRSLVRRLAVRGASFCGVPFRCVLHFVVLLISGVALHELSSSSREDTPDDCGCPCDPLFCFLLSALWGHVAKCLFVQETQSAKDFDLKMFYDVPVQRCHILPSRSHVLGLACWSFWLVRYFPDHRFFLMFRFSSLYTLSLETDCSSSTTAEISTFYRVGWMWLLAKACVSLLGTPGALLGVFSWMGQRIQTQIFQKILGEQHLSPGSASKGRVSSSSKDVGSLISTHWYFPTWQWKCGRIGNLHSLGSSVWRGDRDTCGYLSWPWSPCEYPIWATTSLLSKSMSNLKFLKAVTW